jgi:hypothetical protein
LQHLNFFLANYNVVNPKKIRNPIYADYNPGYESLDSLDRFKQEFQSQGNLNPQPVYQDNYEQFENRNPQNEDQSNELAKNVTNIYGVTPPRSG